MVRTKKRAFRGNGYWVLDKETGQRIINQNHSNLIEFLENQEEMEIDDKLYNNAENFSKPIFKRSEDCRNGAKFTSFVGDGDAKNFSTLSNVNIYDKDIKKLECVAHVAKQFGLL